MADVKSLEQRLANANAAAAAAKPAYDAAKAKANTAYDNYRATIAAEGTGAKFRELQALKRELNQNPESAETQERINQVQASLRDSKSRIDAAREASEAAQAQANEAGKPYLDAEYEAGELEEGIQQASIQETQAEEEAAAADQAQAEDPTSTIKSPEATNDSETDLETEEKYADPNNTPDDPGLDAFGGEGGDPNPNAVITPPDPALGDRGVANVDITGRKGNLPPGAQRTAAAPAVAKWAGVNDLRVILRVHRDYLTGKSSPLANIGGVLFPYTPQISYDNQANYASVNPLHSNYTQYFYRHSAITAIQINGKFTVQNEKDAVIWLATQHLLRSLTKMRFGEDVNAGSPPPVCRLDGYGDYQLANIPVAVQSFKFELPDGVDYIKTDGKNPKVPSPFATTLVPTVSTLNLTLIPIYSRKEIQNYSVDKFISGSLAGKGFL